MNASKSRGFIVALIPVFASLGAASAWADDKLIVNGKPTNAAVRTINGAAYVRLSDIAKALGLIVVKTPAGYVVTKPGGANQIAGTQQGKVGDTLFDGKWRFQVLSVQTPESYVMKTDAELYDYSGLSTFDRPSKTVRPAQGRTLVVLQCRATNAVKEKRTLWTSISDQRIRTALTDMDGSSHTPIGYDFEGGPIQSKWLVPGAALNFPVLFSVPQGTRLKDLLFTLKNNQTDDKPNEVRVSLGPR